MITCPNCGEKRDTSNRYTSPANAEKDARDWAEQHESGKCAVAEAEAPPAPTFEDVPLRVDRVMVANLRREAHKHLMTLSEYVDWILRNRKVWP